MTGIKVDFTTDYDRVMAKIESFICELNDKETLRITNTTDLQRAIMFLTSYTEQKQYYELRIMQAECCENCRTGLSDENLEKFKTVLSRVNVVINRITEKIAEFQKSSNIFHKEQKRKDDWENIDVGGLIQ